MASKTISNEMIYDLLKQQQFEMQALWDSLQEFKADMHGFKRDTNQRFQDIEQQIKQVRADITNLQQNKVSWNAGLIASVVAMSSVASIILIRFLTTIGVKIAENPNLLI